MNSSEEEKESKKKLKDLEEKVDLLDEKILFIFQKVRDISDSIDSLRSAIVEDLAVPIRPVEPMERRVMKVRRDLIPPPEEPEEIPFEEPVKVVTAEEAPTIPVTPLKEIAVPEKEIKPKPPRDPIWKVITKEENLPYFLLLAFWILLGALVVALVTQLLIEVIDTPMKTFLSIGITSFGFVLLSFVLKKWLDRKERTAYYVFPWSFLGLGTAGIFIAVILSQAVMTGELHSPIVFPIAIVVALFALFVSILFKNEFLIGEAALSLVLILLIPLFIEMELLGAASGYFYFAFFGIFIVGSYVLAKLKISAAPSLIALIAFPVLSFIPSITEIMELETLLVVVPSCLVATLIAENAYDNYKAYNRREMRTIITVVDILLPLGSYFYLLFVRTKAGIPSWEILIATLFIAVTYFLTIKRILTSRFEEFDVRNPILIEVLYVGLINLAIFLSLLSEMLITVNYVNYIYLALFLVLQISFAMISMTWRVEETVSIVVQSLTSMIFVEGAFIAFFSNLGGIQAVDPNSYEIVLSIGLSLLFLAPLVNIIVQRNQKFVFTSSASILLLGAINIFILSFFGLGGLSRSICELIIIGISLTFGIITLLHSLGKLRFLIAEEDITLSHLHSISILALTSSLWFIQSDQIINYFIVGGIFVSIAMWIVTAFLNRKKERHISEDILGLIAVSVVFISIPAAISNISSPLAMITTICSVIAVSAITLLTSRYNLIYPIVIYTSQIISLFAFPSATTIYGGNWLLPIVFLIPTLSMLTVSIKDERWWTRIGTTISATIMLILTALSFEGTTLGILIAIDSIVLIAYPITIYIFNIWRAKEEDHKNVTIEYPIDLFLTTLGAIIANNYVTTDPASEALIFVFLVIGTIVGPLIYVISRFLKKTKEIPSKILHFVSCSFIAMIQVLLLTAAGVQLVSFYYYITLLIATTVISVFIMQKEKFDSMTVLPALVSIMFLPIFSTKYTLGDPTLNTVLSSILLAMFIIYLIVLSIGWFDSKYASATFAAYFIGCLGIILSTFTTGMSFFVGLPEFFPLLLFTIWQIGVIVSIQLAKTKPERNVDFYLIWLFVGTLIAISIGQIFNLENRTSGVLTGDLLGFVLTAIPAYLVFILFSSFLQYKMKYSNAGMISHILAIQTLLITVGSVIFRAITFDSFMAEILVYVFFNIFNIILFIVLESLVVEYTLVKTDTPNSEIVNVSLFIPVFLFSLILSAINQYYGIIPMILGIVFYGMSQRHEMKFSSVLATLSIGVSAFFIMPVAEIVNWIAFGIVSGVMALMVISGIILYVRTKNEFHIIATVTIALICETVIGFLSPLTLPLQLGLAFNLALIGLLIGVIFEIREFLIIFSVTSGLLLIPYIIISFIKEEEAGYYALIFLATGILMLLASYLVYIRKKESREQLGPEIKTKK